MWAVTHVGMLLIVAALAGFRCFSKDYPDRSSNLIVTQFIGLIVVLSLIGTVTP